MDTLPRYYSKRDLMRELEKARPYLALTYLQILKLERKGVIKPVAYIGKSTHVYDMSALNTLVDYVDNPPTVYGKVWKTRKEAQINTQTP